MARSFPGFSAEQNGIDVFSLTDGVVNIMWMSHLKTATAVLTTIMAVIGGLLAQQAPAGTEIKPKPAVSAAMAQTEAKVAQLRELIGPQPGEHVTNMAKIAWQRDPWEAAVQAAREGKPVLSYGEGMHGVPCGFG